MALSLKRSRQGGSIFNADLAKSGSVLHADGHSRRSTYDGGDAVLLFARQVDNAQPSELTPFTY